MRRLGYLGVVIAGVLLASPPQPGAAQPMKGAELGKIVKSLSPYFKEKDWQRRDASLLRRLEQVVADIDSKRARSRKPSCLKDLASLQKAVFKSQSYATHRRTGLRRITWDQSPFKGDDPKFYLSMPKRYRASTPAPLILALHPITTDADAYGNQAFLQSKIILEHYFLVAPIWPDKTKATWGTETAEGVGRLLIGLQYALEEFLIDPDRIYVVGENQGATAALDIAMTCGDRFAAVFAVGGGKERALEKNLEGTVVHRLPAGDAVPHLPAYEKMVELMEAEEGLRRNPYPKKIDWRFERLDQQMAWWLLVSRERKREDESEPARITAEIKDGNVIEVTTDGVDAFWVFLNDALVDLDKEVHLVINGVKQDPWKPEREIGSAIEWLMDVGDLGRLYLARKEFSVPVQSGNGNGGDKKDGDGAEGD